MTKVCSSTTQFLISTLELKYCRHGKYIKSSCVRVYVSLPLSLCACECVCVCTYMHVQKHRDPANDAETLLVSDGDLASQSNSCLTK